MSRAFVTLVKRDLLLAFRHRSELANPILFFILVVSLFPLGVGPEPNLLQSLAAGVIWVAALLSSLLSLDGIFRSDFEDGSLEQILMSAHPISLLVLAKVLAHWLITGLPVILVAPLLGVLMQLPADGIGVLMITLLLGTPFVSLVGAIGVGLTVGLRRAGMVLSLLVFPLYIPLLIFAAGAVDTAMTGFPIGGHLSLLAALLVGALTLAPLATAASLRISLN
ncbi:MAG: heme exporter protein CcmB [Chromatiales bacterium]|nr:heme exporter protein CcmB [Chromatiales bacterium]